MYLLDYVQLYNYVHYMINCFLFQVTSEFDTFVASGARWCHMLEMKCMIIELLAS